jgi:hypothetical protein
MILLLRNNSLLDDCMTSINNIMKVRRALLIIQHLKEDAFCDDIVLLGYDDIMIFLSVLKE